MEINNDPIFFIIKVSRAYQNHASKVLEQFGLHRSQPPILFELDREDGISQKKLTEEIGVTPASINNVIRRMERTGFVFRRRDSEDGRVSRVYLTQAGKEIISQVKATSDQMHTSALAGFSEDEATKLRSYLQRVLENLS